MGTSQLASSLHSKLHVNSFNVIGIPGAQMSIRIKEVDRPHDMHIFMQKLSRVPALLMHAANFVSTSMLGLAHILLLTLSCFALLQEQSPMNGARALTSCTRGPREA